MAYSVMIVEDESKILAYMKKKLSAIDEFVICGGFDMPEEALKAFPQLNPDVVFLDVEMPRMTGLELAEHMLRLKPGTGIVFLTAYEQYALDAFRVEAIDYMLKPVTDEDIRRVVSRLRNRIVRPAVASEVRCFGTFEVKDRQGEIVRWPTRKVEELFAYLWVNKNRQLSKWTLVELLWPDMPAEKGAQNLYTTVYRMKQALQQLAIAVTIERGNSTYRLVSDISSDLEELERLMGDPRLVGQQPERAMQLYASYRQPLFGDRGYYWSISLDATTGRLMEELGEALLRHCRTSGDTAGERRLVDTMEARRREQL